MRVAMFYRQTGWTDALPISSSQIGPVVVTVINLLQTATVAVTIPDHTLTVAY